MASTWTRREFVQSAAGLAIGAGGALASTVARTANVRGSDTIKLGLVGCGGRGTGAALQALRGDEGTILSSMGDVFADRVSSSLDGLGQELGEQAATKLQVTDDRRFTGWDSYKHVIDSGVDAVILTTYPAFRPMHLAYAVAAGKHVFAEKPVAVDAPGVRSVLESTAEAQRKNLALVVGFCWRFNDGMRATFEAVRSGMMGDITGAHTTYLTGTLAKRARRPEWSDLEFQMRNWWHFTWISGDHVVEQAVHSIDRLSWAMGDVPPTRVTCLGGRAARNGPEHGHAYDHFAATYEYAHGVRAHHTCRQIDGCPNDNTDYIHGSKGYAVVNGWVPTYSIRGLDGVEAWRYSGPTDRDMYQNEHDELFASIRAGKPLNNGVVSTHSTLMAIMARMAAYSGATITWDQAMNSTESLVPRDLAWGPMPTPAVAVPGQTKFF